MRKLRGVAAWPVGGFAVGLVWGVIARVWMRFISTDPEFSWSGTLAIIGLSGLSGAALGAVEVLRRLGKRGWRRLLAVPALVLFLSPGAVMFPCAVFGGLAISGRGGRLIRVVATALAVAPVVFVAATEELPHLPVLALLWFALLCLALAGGWSVVFRRAVSRRSVGVSG